MRKMAFALIVSALGFVGALRALQPGEPLSDAEEALKDRDYAKAVELLKKAHDQATEGRDRILYLLATAHQHAGQLDEGIAACDRLLKEHPASSWVSKTHFKKGDLLALKKEHLLAAQIYEERVKALTAPERRKPLAMIYVNAAREFLTPKEAGDPSFVPNYVAAQRLLVKSLELEALGPDEESVRFDVVSCEFHGGFDRNQLLKTCDQFLEKFPKGAKVDEVILWRGRALAQLGRWWEARKAWARIVAEYPQSTHAPTALWETAALEPGPRGFAALRELIAKYGSAEIAPQAAMTLADRLAANEDLRTDAMAAYLDVAHRFPKDERAPVAVIRWCELAVAEERPDEAIAKYETFLKEYPESPRWGEVRQRICDLRYGKAHRAFLRKDFAESRKLFDEFVGAYPLDPRAAPIALLQGHMLREEKKLKEAVDHYRRVAVRYPAEASQARTAAGEILEELEEFDAALKEYEKGGAHHKIQELRGKSIYLESERVFTTTEQPTATLHSRNFQKVQCRLWILDLKDYFEKRASTAGLHAVEVAVIAPDHEWEVEVKEFKKHKKHKLAIPLPMKAAGAYIVQAKAENLETTTVVLVSDLAFIAKVGRRGITLLGQDMRRNEALDTVPFRAAADGRVLKDGKTFPEDLTPGRVSILAEVLGNFAFRDFDLSSIASPLKRAPIALLLPDRWTYASDDSVILRIVERDVAENAWVVPKDKSYRLTATSQAGLVLFERDLTLSAQGTATETLDLFVGLGTVRFDVYEVVRPAPKLIGQTQISQGPVAGKEVRFDFLMEDRPYFFGEDVDVTVVLRDSVGRPIRNRAFRYHVAGEAEWKDAKTGKDGCFALRLTETEQFERTGCFMETQFGEVRDLHTIAFLPRGFRLEIDPSTRPLEPLLAGDSKVVRFSARDSSGKPVSARVSWHVTRANEAGERILVASGDLTTDKDGKGSFSFSSTMGGVHAIVLRARDSQNNPVRASTAVSVSDDKDPTVLRLLSEKDEFQYGEPVTLTVHSRTGRVSAVVVVENERIELVKRLTLDRGRNVVSLELEGKYLRNFRVTVAAMHGNKFHSAVRDFQMTRTPPMEVAPDKETYKPGDEVKITVKAKRRAEVWLQVAEHVLPQLSPDQIAPILPGPFFVTDASNTASFAGVTAQVSRELEEALAHLQNLDRDSGTRVMMEPPDAEDGLAFRGGEKEYRDKWKDDRAAVGGGGGGRLGRRQGGKTVQVQGTAEARPVFLGSAMTNDQGEVDFSFRLPLENGQYTVRVYAIDPSNVLSTHAMELKSRADVTVELALPEAIRDGDKAFGAVFVTNQSTKDVKTELGDVPARSVAEFLVPIAPKFSVNVDGRTYSREIPVLPAGAQRVALASGMTFAIGPDKALPISLEVDLLVSPKDRLFWLCGEGDAFTETANLAVRLLALSLAKSPEAKIAAARLHCRPHGSDVPTEVLRFIAAAAHDPGNKPDASHLKALFSQAPSDDQKALILYALSRTEDANPAYVNRLYRAAESLSPRSTAILALLIQADRKEEAKALLARVKSHEPAKLAYADWSNTPGCVRGFLALAGATVDLESDPPRNAFERALHALWIATLPAKGVQPPSLKVNGKDVKPGMIDATILVPGPQKIEAVGALAIARYRFSGEAREPALKLGSKRIVGWPVLEVEGEALSAPAVTREPSEPPSMTRTAVGTTFMATFEYTFTEGEPQSLVLEESIPAGMLIRSVRLEGFLGYRVEPGRVQLLFVRATGEQKAKATLHLMATTPGDYVASPTLVRPLSDIDFFHGPTPAGFAVLKAEEPYRDGIALQPGELYEAGKLYFGRKEWRKAKEPLAKLFDSLSLLDNYAIDVARMLTYISIELGEAEGTVRYFEILKEKLPGEVVPFDKILAVGRAYTTLKEFDRARQVFLGTCDAYFLQEAYLSGELEALGRTRAATSTMQALLRAHPDSDLNREMTLGLGQQLLSQAKTLKDLEKDPHRLTKREMLAIAAETLEDYSALFPADAACDKASLALGSAYLEALENDKAEATGRVAAKRYPKSRYLDSFDYIQAYALFAQKKFVDALTMCDRLETFDYGRAANPGPEAMKNLATLMKAQIFHAKGEIDRALGAYKLVRDRFPDAARALAFLEREAISMAEVTIVPANKANEVAIEYSGVPDVHVKAYKVNLTMLFLKYKGVKDASAIEVAGIRPVLEKTYTLDRPNAKRREKQTLTLDIKEIGAYLVSVKAGEFFTSGLFLKSDLSLTVQEEAQTGTVRVNLSNAATGRFEENVKVTFIGTADQAFRSEKTDLRGIAETEGLKGYAMAIAEKDNHYAFFRGTTPLSGYVPPQQDRKKANQEIDELEKRLEELNEYQQRYGENMRKQQQGVEVERTKN